MMKNKILLIISIIAILSGSLFVTTENMTAKAETTKSRALSDLDTSGTIFDSPTGQEVKDYYSTIQNGDSGESLIQKLETITKKNQAKVKYTSGQKESSSGSGTAWNGYYLYERDYSLSPLTQDEIDNENYKKSDVWITVMYSSSPIHILSGINKFESKTVTKEQTMFEYFSDWNIDTHSGSAKSIGYFTNGSVQIDREHVFPKSFGFNGSNDLYQSLVVGCDAHNLHAGEHVANSSAHSNLPYGNVVNSKTSYISGLTGEIVGYTGTNSNGIEVFEPLDKDKGNIARACFYMAARYHTYGTDINNSNYKSPALTLSDAATKTTTKDPEDTASTPCAYGELSDFLEWNKLDPVDDEEIRRNDLIFKAVQNNRNPFVDFPSWADACFGNGSVSYKDINIRHRYLGEPEESFPDNPTSNAGFFKYTSLDDLKVGNKIIIAGLDNSKYYSLCKSQDSAATYRAHVECSVVGDVCSPASETEIITLVKGTSSGTFGLQTEDGKYLYAGSSSSNQLKTSKNLDDSGSFTPSISDGLFMLTAKEPTTRNVLLYNSTHDRFCCYTSTSSGVKGLTIFGYTPDSFASVRPEANLSFSFTDNNGSFTNFTNVSINIRFNYDFSSRSEPYSNAKILGIKKGDINNYTRGNYFSEILNETGSIVTSWKDFTKDTYKLSIINIPASAYTTSILFVGAVQRGGVWYYSVPVVYSVFTLLKRYSSDDSLIEYTNKDQSKTSIKVSDIAKAFLAEIEGPGEE